LGTEAFILEQDWSFVTRNSVDFRGPTNQPSSKGQDADIPLHAGLICIYGPDSMSAEYEVELFGIVLNELGPNQMVNQAIEITLAEAEASDNCDLTWNDCVMRLRTVGFASRILVSSNKSVNLCPPWACRRAGIGVV
jgi:hypothetical protein